MNSGFPFSGAYWESKDRDSEDRSPAGQTKGEEGLPEKSLFPVRLWNLFAL